MKFDFDDVVEWFQQFWLNLFTEDRILKQATKASAQLETRATIQRKIADKANYKADAVVIAAQNRAANLHAKAKTARTGAKRAERKSAKIRDSFALDDNDNDD